MELHPALVNLLQWYHINQVTERLNSRISEGYQKDDAWGEKGGAKGFLSTLPSFQRQVVGLCSNLATLGLISECSSRGRISLIEISSVSYNRGTHKIRIYLLENKL